MSDDPGHDPSNPPEPLRLGDQEFRAYPLGDRSFQELNLWVRREFLDRVKEAAAGDHEILSVALEDVVRMDWQHPPGSRVLVTVAGAYKLAQLMCRDQKIPRELVETHDGLKEVFDVFSRLVKRAPPVGKP